MDGWKDFIEKKVFVILKNKRQYSGTILGVDDSSAPLIFITILDKFGNKITFAHSEVEVMQEESK
jgi:hypothetical protein